MSSGAKSSLSLQKNQPKVVKPSKFNLSSTWSQSTPKTQLLNSENLNSQIDEDENDEIRLRLRNEDIFDSIMDKVFTVPIEQALEGPLKTLFSCSMCIFWIDNPNDMILYSPSRNISVGLTNSLVGYTRLTRSVIQIQNQQQCPPNFIINTSLSIPENSKHIFFPVSSSDIVYGVIQLIRNPDMPVFSDIDLDSVTFVMNKFSLVGNYIFNTTRLCDISLSYFQRKGQSTPHILDTIENYFQCKSAELWKYEPNVGYFFFDRQTDSMEQIDSSEIGIIGQSLSKSCIINERMASNHPSYTAPFDDSIDGPILVVPYEKNKREIWSLALRGRSRSFNVYDEREVKSLMTFIVRAAVNGSSVGEGLVSKLSSLLEMAKKMAFLLNFSELIECIQNQCIQLFECEKAVILLSDKKKEFFTRGSDFVYLGELQSDRKIPMIEGISIECFRNRKILNVVDPKSDEKFCAEVDCCMSDLEPSMLLAVPLLDLHDESAGVLLLYNKISGPKFTETDEKLAMLFNVFAGIAIQNAKQYKLCNDFSLSLIQFVDNSIDDKNDVKTVISGFMEKAIDVTFCDRITLFVRKTIDEFVPFINAGKESKLGSVFANEAAHKNSPLFVNADRINSKSSKNKKHGGDDDGCANDRSNVTMNNKAATCLISGLFDQKQSANYQFKNDLSNENLYDFPIVDDQLFVVGVIEYHFFNGRSDSELNFFNAFGSLCEFCFSQISHRSPDLSRLGYGDIDIAELIDDGDRLSQKIPAKLQFECGKSSPLFSVNFDVDDFDEFDLIKIVFSIFAKFGLNESFEISNEQLFHFLRGIREKYKKVPFKNWRHSIDVFQFVSCQIIDGKLDKIFTKEQVLALLIASLCHDATGDYFENEIMNFSMEDDYLLSRNCGYSEVANLLNSISVLSSEKSNILMSVDSARSKQILETVVDLILSTNMSLHFTILNKFLNLLNSGELNVDDNEQHKLFLMKIVIKCGDLCSIVRPFEIAKKRFGFIADDFYRCGEIERAIGVVFKSSEMKREEVKKDESLVGFMKSVALPLFQALSKQIDSLSVYVEKINENIRKCEKNSKK